MLELMILGQLGVFIHYFKEWVVANNKGLKYDLKKSIPMAALSSLTTGVLVYLKNDISNLYVITPFASVALGYMGNSIFFSFIDSKKPKLPVSPDGVI